MHKANIPSALNRVHVFFLHLPQVLANYFALRKGPNYSGMAVHYDVHIVAKQDADKPRGELLLASSVPMPHGH